MNNRASRPAALRALNALCAVAILGAALYMLMIGFQVLALTVLCCAVAGAAVPVVASGEGLLQMVGELLQALLDGILAIFEAIASALSGLFG